MTTSEKAAEWPRAALSTALKTKIKEARVLAVGAGGIGCELLKTLVLTGFENVDVIDMDTIETSNLNRQFLFRNRHVGESKAAVAAQAVQQFRPAARVTAHKANIKEARYGVDFFRGFDIILNGLDNLEARQHVNRLCLASGTPLIESGTAGYLGQVSVHLRMKDGQGATSECFECQPKAAPKSYPVCTIRNTPDKPIHCVVWAKDLLFQRLFGSPDAVTDLDEKAEAEQQAQADGETKDDPSEFLRKDGETAAEYARRIFDRVFCKDIEKVLGMEDLWKARKKPTPLQLSELVGLSHASANGTSSSALSATQALGLKDHHKQWTLKENAEVFLKSISTFFMSRPAEVGAAVFDKDDQLAVEFVTAASNLRALCYDIPTQSLFDAKGMAGNIIHAIATTNATIAGMIVVEAMKVLAGVPQACKMSYLQQIPSGKRLITAMSLSDPNPACVVCGTSRLELTIHTGTTPLSTFIDKVLKKRLAMVEPTVTCGGLAYEEGADLEPEEVEANARLLPLTLNKLPGGGITNGSIVSVSDQAQDFTCQLVISHKEDWDNEREPDGFLLKGSVPEKSKEAPADGTADAEPPGNMADDDDGLLIIEDTNTPKPKRKRENDSLELQHSKRFGLEGAHGEPIPLED